MSMPPTGQKLHRCFPPCFCPDPALVLILAWLLIGTADSGDVVGGVLSEKRGVIGSVLPPITDLPFVSIAVQGDRDILGAVEMFGSLSCDHGYFQLSPRKMRKKSVSSGLEIQEGPACLGRPSPSPTFA